MISRIYVVPKEGQRADSYLIDSRLSKNELEKLAGALTNPILEEYYINESPRVGAFSFAIEIGFLPGVTDNVGHTVKEIATDLLNLKKNINFQVYTSKIIFVTGSLENAQKFALTLYNPLIERAYVARVKNGKINLPMKIPKVVLKKQKLVTNINLNVSDSELERISREGVLALDLASMKTIQEHYRKLKRDPTDIELESLAQTWSEHCKHTIFANPIDDIADGLYKTYIKGATNLIRKNKGRRLGGASKNDFCVSVFSDNSGGIVFDKNYLITHKVETHNSPSALDPFGGAIP